MKSGRNCTVNVLAMKFTTLNLAIPSFLANTKVKRSHMQRFMLIESTLTFGSLDFCNNKKKTSGYPYYKHDLRFGVALVGVQPENDLIKLNAGPNYTMSKSDVCFYMSVSKEENSSLLIAESANQQIPDEDLNLTGGSLTKKLSFRRSSFNVSKIQEKVSLIKRKCGLTSPSCSF
jgi:hypothetical protein